MEEIHGYKAFIMEDGKLTDKYGNYYEVGKTYSYSENPVFHRQGFHFCTYPEDTFHFFRSFDNEMAVCKVIGQGEVRKFYDEYNDYYDMYTVSNLTVERVLSREELINDIFSKAYPWRFERLFAEIELTNEEIKYILNRIKEEKRVWIANMKKIEYNIEKFQHGGFCKKLK